MRSSSEGARRLRPLWSSSDAVNGNRDRKKKKVGVSVCAAFAVPESIALRCEKFEPSLDSGVVLDNPGEAFERLVVRKEMEIGTLQVTAKALDAPDDAARF